MRNKLKAINYTTNLEKAIILLNNTIEAGNIFLTEDDQGTFIDLKFNIILASGNYPPFIINLVKENQLNGNNMGMISNKLGNVLEADSKYVEA